MRGAYPIHLFSNVIECNLEVLNDIGGEGLEYVVIEGFLLFSWEVSDTSME